MAGIKISHLPDSAATDGTDVVPVVQGSSTFKMTLAKILGYIQGNIPQQSVETFTLSSTDITNKYVTLSQTPLANANVQAFPRGNTPGIYGLDFTMLSGNRLSWSGKSWESLLISGDVLSAIYLH